MVEYVLSGVWVGWSVMRGVKKQKEVKRRRLFSLSRSKFVERKKNKKKGFARYFFFGAKVEIIIWRRG